MAIFSGSVRSAVLGMDTGLQVILPYDRPAERQRSPCKALYLLHGLGGNHTSWCRHTAVERYAREYGIAVIMPEAQRSFYTNMRYGMRYFDYISAELPKLCSELFHIGTSPQDTYIAGLSMGGYGALLCAFSAPGQYAAAASFSGAVDFHTIADANLDEFTRPEFVGALGEKLEVPDQLDLFLLAEKAAAQEHKPRIFLTCGWQDPLFDMSDNLARKLAELPLDASFKSWDGDHDWDFWDQSLAMALELFFQ